MQGLETITLALPDSTVTSQSGFNAIHTVSYPWPASASPFCSSHFYVTCSHVCSQDVGGLNSCVSNLIK